ncbi:MAG: hypothetical protein ACQETX_09115 [Pseudomonadota bacterium]
MSKSTSRPRLQKGDHDDGGIIGRSRRVLTDKLQTFVDAEGRAIALILTAGEAHDSSAIYGLVDGNVIVFPVARSRCDGQLSMNNVYINVDNYVD